MSAKNKNWRFWNRTGLQTGLLPRMNPIVCSLLLALFAPLIIASDYVVLVDTSDSMSEAISKSDPRIRIETVQEVLRKFIGDLPVNTRLCLMSFNKGVKSTNEVVLAGEGERQKAMKWIDNLAVEAKTKGNEHTYLWTSLGEALKVATKYATENLTQTVVLRALTDGQDTQNVTTLAKVLRSFPKLNGKTIRGNLFILGDFEIKVSDPNLPVTHTWKPEDIVPPVIGCDPPQPKLNEEVTFRDKSTASYAQYEWTIDGLRIGQQKNVAYVFKRAGSYKVELKVERKDGQKDSAVPLEVKIDQPPEADFTFTPGEPETRQETKFSGTSSGKFASCAWFINGKSVASTPDFVTTFDKDGDHEVKFTVTDGAGRAAEKVRTVHVVDKPVNVAFKAPRTAKSGQEVQFVNETTGPVEQLSWDFGDGQKSTAENPTHAYETKTPQQYSVVLRATKRGGKVFQSDPWVIAIEPRHAPPVAKFRVKGDVLKVGTPVDFVDESTGLIVTYEWDFGGEGTGKEKEPRFTFKEPGNKTIKLIVEGPGGKSSTETVLEIAPDTTTVTITWVDKNGKTVSSPSVLDLRQVHQQHVKSGQYARPRIDTFEFKSSKDMPQGGGISVSFDGTAGKAFQAVKAADVAKKVPAVINESGRFRIALQSDAPAGTYSGNLLIQPQPRDKVLINGSAKPISIPVKLKITDHTSFPYGLILLGLLAFVVIGFIIKRLLGGGDEAILASDLMQVTIAELPMASKSGQPGGGPAVSRSQSFTLKPPFQTIAFCKPGQAEATYFYSDVTVLGALLMRQPSAKQKSGKPMSILGLKRNAADPTRPLKRKDEFELTEANGRRHKFRIAWQGLPQQKPAGQYKKGI